MPKFFVEEFNGVLTDADAKHIEKSLRMKPGEEVTVCDDGGTDHFCVIEKILPGKIFLKEIKKEKCKNEANINLTLYICFLKGESLGNVIKHATELGVNTIVPVLSEFCVSRPKIQDYAKKTERYQKIAESAAKQSGRGIIPKVLYPIDIKDVPKNTVMFYEHGGKPIKEILKEIDCICNNNNNNSSNTGDNVKSSDFKEQKDIKKDTKKDISVLIGSEGGFSEKEAEQFKYKATLGKRILRAETAPLAAVTCIMLLTGNLE